MAPSPRHELLAGRAGDDGAPSHRAMLTLALGLKTEAPGTWTDPHEQWVHVRHAEELRDAAARHATRSPLQPLRRSRDVEPRHASCRAPRSRIRCTRPRTVNSWELSDMEPIREHRVARTWPDTPTIVQWGVKFVGYPYVYGGEWGLAATSRLPVRRTDRPRLRLLRHTWWALALATGVLERVAPAALPGWNPRSVRRGHGAHGRVRYNQLSPGRPDVLRQRRRPRSTTSTRSSAMVGARLRDPMAA